MASTDDVCDADVHAAAGSGAAGGGALETLDSQAPNNNGQSWRKASTKCLLLLLLTTGIVFVDQALMSAWRPLLSAALFCQPGVPASHNGTGMAHHICAGLAPAAAPADHCVSVPGVPWPPWEPFPHVHLMIGLPPPGDQPVDVYAFILARPTNQSAELRHGMRHVSMPLLARAPPRRGIGFGRDGKGDGRSTWRIAYRFIMTSPDPSTDPAILHALAVENTTYHDIFWADNSLRDIALAAKVNAELQYVTGAYEGDQGVAAHPPRATWIAKFDDDSFPVWDQLLAVIDDMPLPLSGVYWGRTIFGHVHGWNYMMSADLASALARDPGARTCDYNEDTCSGEGAGWLKRNIINDPRWFAQGQPNASQEIVLCGRPRNDGTGLDEDPQCLFGDFQPGRSPAVCVHKPLRNQHWYWALQFNLTHHRCGSAARTWEQLVAQHSTQPVTAHGRYPPPAFPAPASALIRPG